MKKFISTPLLLSLLFSTVLLLSSFSLTPRTDSRDDNPPISKKENRRKNRLQKREARLNNRLNKSKKVAKRQKIQKKIRGIQKQQDDGFGTPVVGIIGMILSIISFILLIAFLASIIMTAFSGFGPAFISFILLFAGLGSALLGLITSIVALVLNRKNPDVFTGRGFGIAGMIVGSIMLGIFLIAALLFFLLM